MPDTVLVLGSGPIRIGQGIEFDYSCVHCVWSLRELGYRAIIVNNNPETVSTDFDTGDGLYFEPVTKDDVMRVVRHEKPIGVVCQFGGQTAINLAEPLAREGVQILGTSPEAIAKAEDREQFDALLESLGIPRPRGRAVRSLEDAVVVAKEVGYPVLVRPSFVLGGRAMEIVYDEEQLRGFYGEAEEANPGQPVLVDKYLLGVEAEVDVISDGEDTLVPGIMEHIERAGVHSGDSMAVYPPVDLDFQVQTQIVVYASQIAKALGVRGLMNIQFVVVTKDVNDKSVNEELDHIVYVLEVNPRASRTVPYLSKVTGIPMVDLATRCMMGEKLKDLGYSKSGLWILSKGRRGLEEPNHSHSPKAAGWIHGSAQLPPNFLPSTDLTSYDWLEEIDNPILYAVKAPVFSFQKLSKVEPSLGPEMKSTGEILGIDNTYEGALYKALVASGINFKGDGLVLITVRDEDKPKATDIARELHRTGRKLAATQRTCDAFTKEGIPCEVVQRISQGSPNILDLVLSGKVSLMINTPSNDKIAEQEAARIRRACIETGIPCVTSIDTAGAIMRALEVFADPSKATCKRLEEYFVS